MTASWRRFALAAGLAAATFVAAAFTTDAAFGRIASLQGQVRATVDTENAERRAFTALVDEETGVRGYIAAADPVFLEPYDLGRAAYERYRRRPRGEDDPAAADALRAFRVAADAMQPYFAEHVALVRAGKTRAAARTLPAGKAMFDRLRRADAAAEIALDRSHREERAAVQRSLGIARLAVLGMALVLIVGGVLAATLVLRVRATAALARIDALTRLGNRRAFEERLAAALVARRDDERIAVLYLDLDRFKPVNDQFGHEAGDAVLRACAERLRRIVRPDDFLARIGGDEFAAILPRIAGAEAARAVALRLAYAVEAPIVVGGTTIRLGASIGVAIAPDDGTEPGDVVHSADVAMFAEKRAHRAATR